MMGDSVRCGDVAQDGLASSPGDRMALAGLSPLIRRWGGCLLIGLLTLLVVCPDVVSAQTDTGRPLPNRPRRQLARPGSPAAAQADVAAVSLRNNRLNVNVQDQDLHDILANIAAQGDISIRHLEGIPKKRLSLRFSELPIVAGLKRLFRAAEVESYVLVTETEGEAVRVQRILFFPPADRRSRTRPSSGPSRRRSPPVRQPPPRGTQESSNEEENESGSVFEDLKTNTAARRLLSQLVHPNEQVRERALERLVRLVDNDEKQAELLEFLEPLMEDLSSEDRAERDDARQEVRKLLRR